MLHFSSHKSNSRISNLHLCLKQESNKAKQIIFSIFQPLALGIAVASATSNNDPETLKALVKWKNKGSLSAPTRELTVCTSTCNPMFLACTEEYNQCIGPLYALGYRINLPEDIKILIEQILKFGSISNKIHFWWYMVKYPQRIGDDDEMTKEEEDMKRNPQNIFDNKEDIFDSVERFSMLKAHSNPHYLAAEYKFKSDTFERLLGNFDPLRKSLAIAKYAEMMSIFDMTNEFSELKKVER